MQSTQTQTRVQVDDITGTVMRSSTCYDHFLYERWNFRERSHHIDEEEGADDKAINMPIGPEVKKEDRNG